jgi:hypothetical protein
MAEARVISLHPDAETLGDWNAEAGSEPWCKALRLSLQNVVKSIATVPEKVRDYVERAVAHRAWVHWRDADGRPFRDFDAFCAAPLPHGLGRPFSEIRPYVEAVKGPVITAALTAAVAPTHADASASQVESGRKGFKTKHRNDPSDTKERSYGETSSYLAARIARDAPKIRAERRLGELLREMPKAKGSDVGGKKRRIDGDRQSPSNAPPTLADQGISKKRALATRRGKLHAGCKGLFAECMANLCLLVLDGGTHRSPRSGEDQRDECGADDHVRPSVVTPLGEVEGERNDPHEYCRHEPGGGCRSDFPFLDRKLAHAELVGIHRNERARGDDRSEADQCERRARTLQKVHAPHPKPNQRRRCERQHQGRISQPVTRYGRRRGVDRRSGRRRGGIQKRGGKGWVSRQFGPLLPANRTDVSRGELVLTNPPDDLFVLDGPQSLTIVRDVPSHRDPLRLIGHRIPWRGAGQRKSDGGLTRGRTGVGYTQMATAKDLKFNMMMSADDKAMLVKLSERADVSEAQIMRTLIRQAFAEAFPPKRPMTKRAIDKATLK